MHSRAGTSAIRDGKRTPLSDALDLQDAATSLNKAALAIYKSISLMEESSHMTVIRYPDVVTFEPQPVSNVRMTSSLTKEDVEAANVISAIQAGEDPIDAWPAILDECQSETDSVQNYNALVETFIFKINSLESEENAELSKDRRRSS